jgi:hypothetical protein
MDRYLRVSLSAPAEASPTTVRKQKPPLELATQISSAIGSGSRRVLQNSLRCSLKRGSGKPPIGLWFAAALHARLVVLGEDLSNEFSAAAHTSLVEDGLEVVAHGVGRDVQFLRDSGRRQPANDEPGYLALALGQAVGIDDQGGDLRRTCLLEDDRYPSLSILSA